MRGIPQLMLALTLLVGMLMTLSAPILSLPGSLASIAQAEEIGNDAFQRIWDRTDKPVAEEQVSRTWMWGPEANTTLLQEEYAESPGGMRAVQYFDKSRMEITHPGEDPSATWYVTNGLLVVELMTGQLQVGDSTFTAREAADVNVAGDSDDPTGITYAALAPGMAGFPYDEIYQPGDLIIAELEWFGGSPSQPRYLSPSPSIEFEPYAVSAAHYVPETGKWVASPFWDFMNSIGLVYENDAYGTSSLFQSPFYATGLPITQAYWAEVKVGGVYQDVLLQCFERRCLTYTPSNAPEWQVEAGNVGQHYYAWRLENSAADLLAFVGNESGNDEIYVVRTDGTDLINLTDHPAQDNEFEWSPDGTKIVFVSDRDGDKEIYVMDTNGDNLQQLTTNDEADDSEPRWSPDGMQIAFTTTRDSNAEIYIMQADGSQATNFSQYPDAGDWDPRWSPDGSRIAFRSSRTDVVGRFATILIAEIANPLEPHSVECGYEQRFDAGWSPTGDALTYYAQTYQGGAQTFCVVDREGATVTEWDFSLGDYWPVANDMASYTPDGRLVVSRCSADPAHLACSEVDANAGRLFFDPVSGNLELENDYAPVALDGDIEWLGWSADATKLALHGAVCPVDGSLCVYDLLTEETLTVTTNGISSGQRTPIQWQPGATE